MSSVSSVDSERPGGSGGLPAHVRFAEDSYYAPYDFTITNKPKEFFAKIRRTAIYGETALMTPILIQAGNGFVNTCKFGGNILQFINHTSDTSGLLADPRIVKLLGEIRMCVMVAAPVTLYNIIAEIIEIVDETHKGRSMELIDALLRMVEAMGDTGSVLSSFAMGLAMVRPDLTTALSWATPLALVSAGLGVATIAINARGMVQTADILKELQPDADNSYEDALKFLKEKLEESPKVGDGGYYLKRNFEVINREKYGAQILHIINTCTPDKNGKIAPDPTGAIAIAPENLKHASGEMMSALQNRLKSKITSHKIAIVAALISVIGSFIIFMPILGPFAVGVALLAISGAMLLGRFVKDQYSIKHLQDTLDRLCDFNKIEFDQLPDFAKPLRIRNDIAKLMKKASKTELPVRRHSIDLHHSRSMSHVRRRSSA